jgi:predicted DNA-binding protein YlxM (UPF0122 family)
MAYSQKIIDAIADAPKTLGNKLGRWAVHLDFPVTKIAYALGVTRQTVYNWFIGKTDVFVAYEERVDFLLKIMQSSKTADEAWRKICAAYGLKP